MAFHKLDLNTWERREHFAAYSGATACTYSMTADVDITGLPEAARRRGAPFHARARLSVFAHRQRVPGTAHGSG